MTTTVVFASSTDGYLQSTGGASYSTALNGSGTVDTDTGSGTSVWGQSYNSGLNNYVCWITYLSFTFTPVATELITAAAIRLQAVSAATTSFGRNLELREYDWGGSLTSADWLNPSQIQALPFRGLIGSAQNAGTKAMYSGMSVLNTRLDSAGPLRVIAYSNVMALSSTPGVDESAVFCTSEASGTSQDPALIYTSVTKNQLVGVIGAQVQLSDGTHAFIERSSQFSGTESFILKHHNGASASTVATLYTTSSLTDFNPLTGAQGMTLVADASDNLYVLGPVGTGDGLGGAGSIGAKAFTKGVGYSWTAGTFRSTSMPAYSSGGLNNVAAAWHNVGTNGTIMAVMSHDVGTVTASSDIVYALINCQYLLTGTGSLLRNSGGAQGVVAANATSSTNHTPAYNESGTSLDVIAAPGTTDRGYVLSATYKSQMGDNNTSVAYRYVLNAGGTAFSDTDGGLPDYTWMTKDAGSRAKLVGISPTVFASIAADADTGYGISAVVQQNFGTDLSFSLLAWRPLDVEGITSLPTPADGIHTSTRWDALFDPVSSKIWVYYLDRTDNRKLMRTAISTDTYAATREEIVVSSSVGASGSTNYGIRVHRGATNGQQILVSVGNLSGSTHSTVYVLDGLNAPPYGPTLTPKLNFDAAASASFAWTFADPNPGDTQSAFQLQINSASGTPYYDTGKMGGTISYIGVGTAASANYGTLAPPLPSAWAPGDLLLMMATVRNSASASSFIPSGWSSLYSVANVSFFGRIARTGDTTPSVLFTGGAAGDDTIAQIAAFRGTVQDITQVLAAGGNQLNGSGQDIGYPALTVPNAKCAIVYAGWKQDDWTSVAPIASATEISEVPSTIGNDSGQVWDYAIQGASASNVASGSFTVTGGGAAISRGFVLALNAHQTPTASTFQLGADMIQNGQNWQWRVKTWDATDLEGAWSTYGTFTTSSGATVTVTDPATDNPAGVIEDEYLISWSVMGMTQSYYRVRVIRTDTSAQLSDTGWVTSADTTYNVTGMLTDVEYQIQVTVRNFGLVESSTGYRLITPSYSSPEAPTIAVTAFSSDGYVLVNVDNPAPTGDRPEVTGNLIRRRVNGTSDAYVTIGSCDPDGEFRDYAAASGITYEYVARGVA